MNVLHVRWPFLSLLLAALLGLTPMLASAEESTAIVKESVDEVLEVLRADPERAREDPEFVIEVVEDKVLPHVDVEGMARLVLARHWRDATDEQRTRFTDAFTQTLLQAYGSQLGEYLDSEVRIMERRSRQDERMAVVATEIVLGQGESNVRVNYRLRRVDGTWKVFDVEAEGLSFVGNFRTRFNEEVNRNGLESLIVRLEEGDTELLEEIEGTVGDLMGDKESGSR